MHKYASKNYDKQNMACASSKSLPISTKTSMKIVNLIRNKNLHKAREILNKKEKKASKKIVELLKAVESNAQFKGLNTSNLVISHICVNKASRPWHYGRQRRRKMKRTHIEVIVGEGSLEKENDNEKKERSDSQNRKKPNKKK